MPTRAASILLATACFLPFAALAADPRPPEVPRRFLSLIGEYGKDKEVIYILEKDNRLQFQERGSSPRPLKQLANPYEFEFPKDGGPHAGLSLGFGFDPKSQVTGLVIDLNQMIPRRPIDGENGQTFRIKPVRPVEEIRKETAGLKPPSEPDKPRKPDLVDLVDVVPGLKLDVRYATSNNFLGTPLYTSARALMQRPAAEALAKVQAKLAPKGYGLLIHDAYRPWRVTKLFWEATPAAQHTFVADPAKGSKHNRGCAVDLTLCELSTGKPVEMVGGYDEFSDRSYPDYPGGTSRQRWHREMLRAAMEAEGFAVNDAEWWHFDFHAWQDYPIIDIPFESLPPR
jgi:D-alanyl-D-alanine dipeptidase